MDFPVVISVGEDREVELEVTVRNKGNMQTSYELIIRTNLGDELLQQSGTLAPAARQSVKCLIRGTYRLTRTGEIDSTGSVAAVELRLRHTDKAGQWRAAADGIVNIPVKVQSKKTKLETDALAGFDEV
jgi:hypothetical protein